MHCIQFALRDFALENIVVWCKGEAWLLHRLATCNSMK